MEGAPCCPGPPTSLAASTSTSSAASCCAGTRSVTRMSGRCSSTCRRGRRRPGHGRYPAVYVIQVTPGTWPCGGTGRPSGVPFPEAADAVFAGRRRRRPSWCSSTRGPGTAAASSWTRQAPAAITPTCAMNSAPWVDALYRTLPDAGHRAIMGKSSGGFWRDDDPDALGPTCLAPWPRMPAMRCTSTATCRSSRPPSGTCAVRRGHLALVARVHLPGGLHQGGGHVAAHGARCGGVLLG